MKIVFALLITLLPFTINAQTISFKIDGWVEDPKSAKFAYLSTLSQQIPISSDKLFMMVPVVNGKYEFNSSFDLEGKSIQQASIFFDERGNITKDELALKFKNLIWVSGRDSHLFMIILESMSLQTKDRISADKSVITENGIYNKQFYEYKSAARNQDLKQLVNFVKTYNNSPVSLIAFQIILAFNTDDMKKLNESASNLFNTLSPQIKASKEGVEMKKKLNNN